MRTAFRLEAASLRLIPALVMTAFLLGCGVDPFPQKLVERLDEAGSTHIAVLSVTDWEGYKDELQPFFEMTTEEALDRAIPSTIRTEEKLLSALTARLALAPERTSATETETLKREGSETSVQTEEITKEVRPGEVRETPKSPFREKTAAALPPSGETSALKGELELDPILQHLAATAIYQEVQMLNTYIDDAATGSNYRAYIVRLQVSLMPAARNMPYDAYVNLSFFYVPTKDSDVPGPSDGVVPLKNGEGQSGLKDEVLTENSDVPEPTEGEVPPDTGEHRSKSKGEASPPVANPKIIPLLVTDNLEAALSSRSAERIREFALALPFMFQGFGGVGEISHLVDNLQAAVSRDLNSVFSVALVSDNTVRVRLGAMRSGPRQYAMVPRTHNVTVLLLVDEDGFKGQAEELGMQIFAKTMFVNAESGKPLPPRSHAEGRQVVLSLVRNYAPSIRDDDNLEILLQCTQRNDYQRYQSALKNLKLEKKEQESNEKTFPFAGALWADLLSARVGSQFAYASFQVAKPTKAPDATLTDQTPLLFDNGKDTTTAALYGGKHLKRDELTAILKLYENGDGDKLEYTVLAEGIEVLDRGREVWLTFPSLAFWELDGLVQNGVKLSIEGAQREQGAGKDKKQSSNTEAKDNKENGDGKTNTITLNCIYHKKATPSGPPLEIIWRGAQIIASESVDPKQGRVGVLPVELNKKAGNMTLEVRGANAEIDKCHPKEFAQKTGDNVFGLKQNEGSGTVAFQLYNLDQANGVTLIGMAASEKVIAGPVWIPVVNRPDDR